MKRTAEFSPCRKYRYTLWREWGGLFVSGTAMFIGLNPSTADETKDDPTVRRCIRYARDWGYAGMCMTNIFAFRATDPNVMKAAVDPVGPENDTALVNTACICDIVVAAWGVHGAHLRRHARVLELIPGLRCLTITQGGFPGHPLYLPASLTPKPYPVDV